MAIGFRKSLFGFNRDDVIGYVKQLHNNFSEKEAAFEKEIQKHDELIAELESKQKALLDEKALLEEKVAEYNKKSAEMERLSENIGKLYLVAQTNAKTIMDNARENSRITNDEIQKNVSAIEQTHAVLDELRQSIAKTAESFTNEVDNLMHSLSDAKEKIVTDAEQDKKASAAFSSVFESLTAK